MVHTTQLATMTSMSIRDYSGFFHFFPSRDDAPLAEAEGFTGFDWGNPLELLNIRLDPGGVLVLFHGDRRFVLGRCPCAVADHSYIAEIYPAPGDTTLITLGRGFASWPQAVFRRSKILGTLMFAVSSCRRKISLLVLRAVQHGHCWARQEAGS